MGLYILVKDTYYHYLKVDQHYLLAAHNLREESIPRITLSRWEVHM